ncbi:S-adenosyl-L-methionine-dependent methyltransferase [Lophiostoma macrostomum CBS 122681]|uniref:S-adenosyl-L-methionine-dependent methyltransferase n=1 Tax=Lophiostoma macrostomum CBS 122681 TaxID=1314788 RepID=A0A6A6TPU0_9PLEO|nr:S-adenosyl-L-methionine-dependent methyltransferase [Lophiostoma macrostomum CBS 122681]
MADPTPTNPSPISVAEAPKSPQATGDLAISHFGRIAPIYDATSGGASRELARYLVDLIDKPISQTSIVLDNAAGTGQVTQEFLRWVRKYDPVTGKSPMPQTMFVVDGSDGMISTAKIQTREVMTELNLDRDYITKVNFRILKGEDLHEFKKNTFWYSFTNAGLLFFGDPVKGATEIFRTLKPGLSTIAVITTWKRLSYIDIINEAQWFFDNTLPQFKIPIADEWFTREKLFTTMVAGGLLNVEVHSTTVHYAFETHRELVDGLINLLPKLMESLDSDSKHIFRNALSWVVQKYEKIIERDGKRLVGLEMEAWVGTGRKFKAS